MNLSRFATPIYFAASPASAVFAHARESLAVAETPPTLPGGELIWLWVQVIAFLALLAAGAVLLNYYYRRKRPGMKAARSGRIHLADTCALGNRQYLAVAQFGRERHLLGISPNGINHLSNLRDIEGVESDFEAALVAKEKDGKAREDDK